MVTGRAWDVAVDLRRSSPTFGKWFGLELSAANKRLFWVPPGFGHGFVALEDGTDFLYKCTSFYEPAHEHSLLWNDPTVGIEWPLGDIVPQLSPKDAAGKPLAEAVAFLLVQELGAAAERAGVAPAAANIEDLRDQLRLEALGAGVASDRAAIPPALALLQALL